MSASTLMTHDPRVHYAVARSTALANPLVIDGAIGSEPGYGQPIVNPNIDWLDQLQVLAAGHVGPSRMLGAVAVTPLRLRLPEKCCGATGRVRPESTIQGDAVAMSWCCRACSYEWPVSDADRELPERRTGQPDRRRLTREDRRNRQP